ncbi:MAG TPA: response regulator [Ignavibacteriaceae bacterium]|nr:response regulator [Ignavibacteriaceae bacterium]
MENKLNVLIAEDDRIISLDLVNSLTALGYNVYEPATNGIEIVNMALTLKPDVILMDIKLVGTIDGIDAAKTIQLNRNIPIIFITAYGTEKSHKKVKFINTSKIIQKPYNIGEVDRAIKEALNLNGNMVSSKRGLTL